MHQQKEISYALEVSNYLLYNKVMPVYRVIVDGKQYTTYANATPSPHNNAVRKSTNDQLSLHLLRVQYML